MLPKLNVGGSVANGNGGCTLCDMLTHLEAGAGADTLMLTHAVRDLANLCAEQQRQLNTINRGVTE